MDMIADILLVSGALGVAFYCFVLSRRLTRFTDLEQGVGGAVAVLSAQVDDLNKALDRTRDAAATSGDTLHDLTERADAVARKLELHVAAMHDLPVAPIAPDTPAAAGTASDADPEPEAPVLPIFSTRARIAPVPTPLPAAAPKPTTGAAPVPSFFAARRPAAGAAR